MSGLFITFEGSDGAGKTTQCKLLYEYLIKKGFSVLNTREPGGNKISEKIRDIIIDTENKNMKPMTEALLYAASRAQIIEEILLPELKSGSIVICDRFVDSSIVYQGYARGIGEDIVYNINKFAVNNLTPDITFFLKLTPEQSLERKKNQSSLDRIESEKLYFHKKVFYGYMQIAEKYPERVKVIDAYDDIYSIHKNIADYVDRLISERCI